MVEAKESQPRREAKTQKSQMQKPALSRPPEVNNLLRKGKADFGSLDSELTRVHCLPVLIVDYRQEPEASAETRKADLSVIRLTCVWRDLSASSADARGGLLDGPPLAEP